MRHFDEEITLCQPSPSCKFFRATCTCHHRCAKLQNHRDKPGSKKGILLTCLDGKGKFLFESLRGPVILNVWGSWCAPCREEIPYFVQVSKTKKIRIIGIDASESSDAAGMSFVKAHDMNWPQLSDIKNKTKGTFGLGVPVSRFIDVDGKTVYEKIGPFKSFAEIQKAAKDFLGVKI
jgi:thiol-disulfide isomerase/thioredoxin